MTEIINNYNLIRFKYKYNANILDIQWFKNYFVSKHYILYLIG